MHRYKQYIKERESFADNGIYVRPYTQHDLMLMNHWLFERDLKPWQTGMVPKIGFVACANETPAAIAFLREIEGGFGMFDGMASNPSLESKERHKAIRAVINYIIIAAKDLNYSALLALTAYPEVITRAEANGFIKLPHVVMHLGLENQ